MSQEEIEHLREEVVKLKATIVSLETDKSELIKKLQSALSGVVNDKSNEVN